MIVSRIDKHEVDVYHLPQDIFPDRDKPLDRIILHDYSAPIGSFTGRSMLQMNAISLVISGEKTMRFAEKTVFIHDDEFHFLSASNCLVSMDLSNKGVFRSILLFFDNKVLTDFYLRYDALICRQKSTTQATEPYVSIRKDAFIRHYIESLALLTQSGKEIPAEMKQLKFDELMLHLVMTYPEAVLSFRVADNGDLDDLQIRKAVETHIANPVGVDELAFLCNMSVSTFKRRFTKLYGTSPTKWLLQQRMELAKDLLSHYHEKPSEVYYKVGYENHSSFTQSFKQLVGLTPKDFQLQQLTVNQQLLSQ